MAKQQLLQTLPPERGEGERVRIGPISVFALIIILCMAVLAVLTVSTANASLVMSQRLATATSELYLDETAAQTFLAELDGTLSQVRSTSGAAAASGMGDHAAQSVQSSLVKMRDKVQSAVDDKVEMTASVTGNQVKADFTCENGRTLNIVVTIRDDATYRIDKWKMTAVVNEEEPAGTLWTGM